MKTRNGFVSNSSSSSFIVRVRADATTKSKGKLILSSSKIKTLLEDGFKYTSTQNADQLLNDADFSKGEYETTKNFLDDDCSDHSACFLGLVVSCNQDDIIDTLVKQKISFKAAVNYGIETIFYDGKTTKKFKNYGIIADIYGEKAAEQELKNEN